MSLAESTTGILVKRRPSPLPAVVDIASSSAANPSVITFDDPHLLTDGDTILIAGHTGSTPNINGWWRVVKLSATTIHLKASLNGDPLAVTVAGTGGTGLRDFEAIAEITKVTPPGYSRNEIPTATHNEGAESKVLGMLRQRNCAFSVNYVGSLATHIAIQDDIINNRKRDWLVEFPSGIICGPAAARVQQFMLGDAPLDAAQTADCALSWAELVNIYQSYAAAA